MGSRAYTHSTWVVKPGLEGEFVHRWHDLAQWSAGAGLTAGARLLRDVDRPNRFVSFGPWQSLEAVRRWRADEGYHQRVRRLQEVLESFDPHTLEEISRTS
jgi:heme-degrading monooxygenase HmoA